MMLRFGSLLIAPFVTVVVESHLISVSVGQIEPVVRGLRKGVFGTLFVGESEKRTSRELAQMVEEFGQRAGLTYDREAQAHDVLHARDETQTPGVSQTERLLDGFFNRGVLSFCDLPFRRKDNGSSEIAPAARCQTHKGEPFGATNRAACARGIRRFAAIAQSDRSGSASAGAPPETPLISTSVTFDCLVKPKRKMPRCCIILGLARGIRRDATSQPGAQTTRTCGLIDHAKYRAAIYGSVVWR
jgi:hypothetical protein